MDCGVVALDPLISLNNKMHCVPSIIIILLCTWTVCVNQVTKTMSPSAPVVPIGSKGLVWSTMSLSPRSAPRIGVELARCHAGREQIRASPSQIDRSTSASAQRRRAPARSSSAHGGGAVAAVHRIGRYICVFPLRICYHAPCWCVCVIEWSVSGSPAYDVDGITQRVCKTLTEASACTIPRRTGHARTATQIYMALPRKKKSWHARAE